MVPLEETLETKHTVKVVYKVVSKIADIRKVLCLGLFASLSTLSQKKLYPEQNIDYSEQKFEQFSRASILVYFKVVTKVTKII